jgi:hypothetical protein
MAKSSPSRPAAAAQPPAGSTPLPLVPLSADSCTGFRPIPNERAGVGVHSASSVALLPVGLFLAQLGPDDTRIVVLLSIAFVYGFRL